MDVLCKLTNGAEVLVRQAVITRGPEGTIEGEVRGSGHVRFPVSEVTSQRLADDDGLPVNAGPGERRRRSGAARRRHFAPRTASQTVR